MQKNNNVTYWQGIEEVNPTLDTQKKQNDEFAEDLPLKDAYGDLSFKENTPRRDFLKLMGFGVGAVALAACNEAPVRKSIPYLIKPEEITPGVPNFYASTIGNDSQAIPVLVKTREGRPIKLEGNTESPLFEGSLPANAHGSILNLYDSSKLKGPKVDGNSATWDELDEVVIKKLAAIQAAGGKTVVLSSSINGPSSKKAISAFTSGVKGAENIIYDAISYSGMLDANNKAFGKRVIPNYHFDKANVIVSFSADFLGTWLSNAQYTKDYAKGRRPSKDNPVMSRHIQFESNLSLAGSNADERIPVTPADEALLVVELYNEVAKLAGANTYANGKATKGSDLAHKAAKELWANKGASLVVSGSNDVSVQLFVNATNYLLGNYGNTIDLSNHSQQKMGSDAAMNTLIDQLKSGEVKGLICINTNPVYTHPRGAELAEAMKKAELVVSCGEKEDETGINAMILAPAPHFLETWDDFEPVKGHFSIAQPTISKIFNTRQYQDSLMKWAGASGDFKSVMKATWKSELFPKQSKFLLFDDFWKESVRNGVFTVDNSAATSVSWNYELANDATNINNAAKGMAGVQAVFYQKVGILDGANANNPWLQELPDPISKVVWDNYACLSRKFAKDNGIDFNSDGRSDDVVEVVTNKGAMVLPVHIQPGQAYGTVGIAMGYGRTHAGKAADGVGVDVFSHSNATANGISYITEVKSIKRTGASYELAQTQTYYKTEGRPMVRETTLGAFAKDPSAGNHSHHSTETYSLWPERNKTGHHWAMGIDLTSCIGCSACVVSCQVENNVPVVGRDEVRRRREMHWIRIDRYYKSYESEDEKFDENPEVIFQPMLCQHCDNAPCESVCPVLATMHSSEGLNQQIYNRCVGTRYCANNCPYKVRRFNWFKYADNDQFDYNLNDDLGKMVLNPDVVVRSRGVMEKCTFCVQKIQAGKLDAKIDGRPLKDGDVKTACQQGCPTNAIVFGDVNDKDSEVNKWLADERRYFVLEELNVQPGIGYLTQIRNKEEDSNHNEHHA